MHLLPIRKARHDITKWDPLDEVSELHERFNQFLSRLGWQDPLPPESTWLPKMDVLETDKEVTLKLDVPGMERKEVEVQVEEGDLVIQGERRHEKEEEKDNYVHFERSYGSFYRRFKLPDYVNHDGIKAHCKNGVLEVKMEKIPGKKKEVKSITVE